MPIIKLVSKPTLVYSALWCSGWDSARPVSAGPCQYGRRRQPDRLEGADLAPSCLPVCERHAAASSLTVAVPSCSGWGIVRSFPSTRLTIVPPQTQATASQCPSRRGLSCRGPSFSLLSVNDPILCLCPPSPREVDASSSHCLCHTLVQGFFNCYVPQLLGRTDQTQVTGPPRVSASIDRG